jgi:glycosyltransferase involved in cell wall biosynthesis
LLESGIPENKLFVKPNFIDATNVAPCPGSGNYVVYLGRLSSEKGVWTLVRAFEVLKDPLLKIAGTGPLEIALKSYVREKGIKNVEFVGFKSGLEKMELLRGSLFSVVPSEWYETFALVALEAYAAGKPVLGSNLGSLPYVIENGRSGLLFEPANAVDLAEKTRHLLSRPSAIEAMGRYARSLVETKYGPAENYKTLMEIFSQVCEAC